MTDIIIPQIKLAARWGPNDPEVESIWFLFKDAVRKFEDDKLEDEADFRVDRIYEKLDEARNHYVQIMRDDFLSRPTSEQSATYNALYGSLWGAYKDRLSQLAKAVGYDISCVYAGYKEYEAQMNAFTKKYSELVWLKSYIDLQKANWQDKLRDNRNVHMHDGDLRNKIDLQSINNSDDAKMMFILTTRAIEGIGISIMSYKFKEYWNVITLNNRATVFDRSPRYEIRHVIQGMSI